MSFNGVPSYEVVVPTGIVKVSNTKKILIEEDMSSSSISLGVEASATAETQIDDIQQEYFQLSNDDKVEIPHVDTEIECIDDLCPETYSAKALIPIVNSTNSTESHKNSRYETAMTPHNVVDTSHKANELMRFNDTLDCNAESNDNSSYEIDVTQDEFTFSSSESAYKAINRIFSKSGGLKNALKYKYISEEELKYVHSLNLLSIWWLMPFGSKGLHGIDKRLRARAMTKWRKLLCHVRDVYPPEHTVFCTRTDEFDEECGCVMVPVYSLIPYSAWKNERHPICDHCQELIQVKLDKFFYHCVSKKCPIDCLQCCREVAPDPDTIATISNTGESRKSLARVYDDDDIDDTVGDCSKLCKGCVCVGCARKAVYHSDKHAKRQESMASMLSSPSIGTSSKRLSGFFKDNGMDDGKDDECKRLLDTDDHGDVTMFKALTLLASKIEKEPSVFFPYLDSYIVSGLKTKLSCTAVLFVIMVFITQTLVPLFLILQVNTQYNWKSVVVMGVSEATTTASDRAYQCKEIALSALDYSSMTLAKYTSVITCIDYNKAGKCIDYSCQTTIDSVCNRESVPARKLIGFLLISLLCIQTMKTFYEQASGFVFAGSAAVSYSQRQQSKQENESTTHTHRQRALAKIDFYYYDKNKTEIISRRLRAYHLFICYVEYLFVVFLEYSIEVYLILKQSYVDCFSVAAQQIRYSTLTRRVSMQQQPQYNSQVGRNIKKQEYISSIFDSMFSVSMKLLPNVSLRYTPKKQMTYIILHVIHNKLPVPYEVLNFLKIVDKKLTIIDPKYVLLSLLVNFIAMGLTLTASLYVTVQSKQISDIVLNTLALQFLLTLDDISVNREAAHADIATTADSLCKTLSDIEVFAQHQHERGKMTSRKSTSKDSSTHVTSFASYISPLNSQAYDADSQSPSKSDSVHHTADKEVIKLYNRIREQLNVPHGIYTWYSYALNSAVITSFYAWRSFFLPTWCSSSAPETWLTKLKMCITSVWLASVWIAILCASFISYAFVGFFVVLPISMPIMLILFGVLITSYGVECI